MSIHVCEVYVRVDGCDILKGVSMDISENCLLLGPNGSGQTTLLRVLSGLLDPARGEVVVDRVYARKARGAVSLVATSLEEVYYLLYGSCIDLIRLYSDLLGVPESDILSIVESLGLSLYS